MNKNFQISRFLLLLSFIFIQNITPLMSEENVCNKFEELASDPNVSNHPYNRTSVNDYVTLENFGFSLTNKVEQDGEGKVIFKGIYFSDVHPKNTYFHENTSYYDENYNKFLKTDRIVKINGYEISNEALLEVRNITNSVSYFSESNYSGDLKYLLHLGLIERSYVDSSDVEFEIVFGDQNFIDQFSDYSNIDSELSPLSGHPSFIQVVKDYDFVKEFLEITITVERDGVLIDLKVSQETYDPVPTVTAFIDFLNIQEIDGKNNIFSANYSYELQRDDFFSLSPLLAQKFQSEDYKDAYYFTCRWSSDYDTEEFGEMKYIWFPELSFVNRMGFDSDKIKQIINLEFYKNDGNPVTSVSLKEVGLADFTTDFSVETFPFDTQTLKMELINSDGAGLGLLGTYLTEFVMFDPFLMSGGYLNYNDPRDNFNINRLSGWKMGEKTTYDYNHTLWNDSKLVTSVFGIEQKIYRTSYYFIFKLFSPILLILIVCWSVFWTKSEELESRLTVTITCFLALVAYTFVIDDDLPKLEYLTLMDRVILISYIFAAVPSLLAIFSHRLFYISEKRAILIDRWSLILGPLFYVSTVYLVFMVMASDNVLNTSKFLKSITFN